MPRDNFDKIDEEYFNTILDEDFNFQGNIQFEEDAIVKGYIKGTIDSKNDLIIGPNAQIDADIKAKTLQCFGKINGNVIVEEEVYFHAPAELNGSLKTQLFTLEKGCFFNGKVEMVHVNSQNKTINETKVKSSTINAINDEKIYNRRLKIH